MLKVPGLAAAQRFTAVPWMGGDLPVQRYLALYALNTEVEDATRQEVSELLLDERRKARPVGVIGRRAKKPPEVLIDHAIQHALLGVTRSIAGHAQRHGADIGAAPRRRQ